MPKPIKPLSDEQRIAIYGDKKRLKGTKEGEIVQQSLDVFADKKRLHMMLERFKEEGLPVAKGIQKYFPAGDEVKILRLIAREIGLDFNTHTLADIYGGDFEESDIRSKKDFWSRNGATAIVSAVIDQDFYDGLLGDANCITRADVPIVRENGLAWTDAKADRLKGQVQQREINLVNNITHDEPFIGYEDRPVMEKTGVDSGWTINDVISMVNPVSPGDKPRGIYLDNTIADEEFDVIADGTPGVLAEFKEDKEVTDLAQYRVGTGATDVTVARAIRVELLRRGIVDIGRRFGRTLKINAANMIASKLKTGNHNITGLGYSISTTDTYFSYKTVDELMDSYQIEMVNRCIGKSKPLTELKRNSNVDFVANNPHYIAAPHMFMDIGGSMGGIGNCKIDSSALDSAFTDDAAFTFDVMNTLILNVSPGLEMDVEETNVAVGAVLRWLRTALSLWVPEPGQQCIRKISHA